MMELYIGGYAEPGKNGVLKCVFDGEHVNVIDSNDELYDPSWVFHHPSKTLLYAVEALPLEGNLAVLSEVDGHLKLLTKVSTKGAAPCHISMPPDAPVARVRCLGGLVGLSKIYLVMRRGIGSSGGSTPRDFLPVAGGLLVANQDSNGVCLLRWEDGGCGVPIPCLEAVRPTCLAPVGR